LGTKHGKERVLGPALDAQLGVRVELLPQIDTDTFGTFTREVPRQGTAKEAARAKALAAIEAHGAARLGLASEGSFGPHPVIPFAPLGVELVLLLDRDTGLELYGMDVTLETNFASRRVETLGDARSFATQALFPSHALIAMAAPQGEGEPALGMTKGIVDARELDQIVGDLLRRHGGVWLETDMRAHLNPTRMQSIERAALALVRAAQSHCPQCERPGYVAVERLGGLPCADCGGPTEKARAELFRCVGCDHNEERPLPGVTEATAFDCPYCNP
jgi:hypothetical protein